MPAPVYRVLGLLCALVEAFPIGTNLGLLHLFWMLLSGQLLGSRGAIFPGLQALGLSDPAVRRAWVALGQGSWSSSRLIRAWAAVVQAEGYWEPHVYGGYRPVAVDITAFWRPQLQDCPTRHYDAAAGQARPAIPLGVIARVGSVVGQRFGVLLALVRADPADPSGSAHLQALLAAVVERLAADEVAVTDREFTVALLVAAGVKAWVTRLRKNFTARRATPPAYRGRGPRPRRGTLVRPLARRYGQRELAATPPDQETQWTEAGRDLRAAQWFALVPALRSGQALTDAAPGSPPFNVTAIYDPAYTEPLLVATPLALTPQDLRGLYRDRWVLRQRRIEQLPLAAKQMLGAARQFVHAEETCQRFPELALIAGAVLTYAAATSPAVPTGAGACPERSRRDRQPRRTPGRLRRVLALAVFPHDYPWPARIRVKKAVTDHLPTGFWGQRRRPQPTSVTAGSSAQPSPTAQVA
jgi:hypothetical protein